MEQNDSFNHPLFDFEEEEPQKRTWWFYAYRVIGVLVIAGLIYITGIQQALFYKRTPLGVPQVQTESILNADTIDVPLRIFIFRSDGFSGSDRNIDDIRQMVENASLIWDQADIDFDTESIITLEVTDVQIESFFNNPAYYIQKLSDYDRNAINVFLTRSLKGINGIAFIGIRSTAVADFTTVYDFRVFAHEVGHILGLDHIDDNRFRLMHSGANGFNLTEEEVIKARETAINF